MMNFRFGWEIAKARDLTACLISIAQVTIDVNEKLDV